MNPWLQIVFSSGGLIGLIIAVLAFLQNRRTVNLAQPKQDAEAFAAGSNAQNETIDRLDRENARLSKKVEDQGERIGELERRLGEQDARERLFIRHIALSDEWMAAANEGHITGPPPRLVIGNQP